jgi:hypothetical protein
MAGNLKFISKNCNILKIAQILFMSTPFDQKLNEDSENHHIYIFDASFVEKVKKLISNSVVFPVFLHFSRKSCTNIISKIILVIKLTSSIDWYQHNLK